MIVELWLLPAGVTAFSFFKAFQNATDVSRTYGQRYALSSLYRAQVWGSHLIVAAAFSALAWLLWAVWA